MVLDRLYHHPCYYQEWLNRCGGIFHPVKAIASVRKNFVVVESGPFRRGKIFCLNPLGRAVVNYYRLSRGIPRRGGFDSPRHSATQQSSNTEVAKQ